ncbi:unnamed protein product [Allacma fusca]|uniref:hAT-like transposase RNase-H fold domain-containing protein n=1 Tax=Allacma fusca TaxID=39272 RepID=A0A8J2NPY6_9HEXA|nr:unnamed protein product [Allacma fusca]
MLERLSELRKPFELLRRNEPAMAKFSVSDAEWEFIDEMIKFLKPFEHVTLLLSKSTGPTMSLSAAVYIELFNHLESFTPQKHCSGIVKAATSACSKLNKYYPQTDSPVYVIGLVLDRRCKFYWYRTVGISEDIVKANKKEVISNWKTFYKVAANPNAKVKCGQV